MKNKVYNEFVSDRKDDIVGMIAYSLYKRKKMDYIQEFIQSNVQEPSDEDLATFHNFVLQHRDFYINQAEKLDAEYVSNIVQEKLDKYSEELFNKHFASIHNKLEPEFLNWYAIGHSILATIIMGLISYGGVYYLAVNGIFSIPVAIPK
jgi:hypothetical protein